MQAGSILHLRRMTRENSSTIPDNMTYADQLMLQDLSVPMSEARRKATWPQVRDITSQAQSGELVRQRLFFLRRHTHNLVNFDDQVTDSATQS